MKNQTHIYNLLILLSLMCVVCESNKPNVHDYSEGRAFSISTEEDKGFSLQQHHQNLIKSYNKTNTIFTQRRCSNQQNTAKSSSAENRFLSFFTLVNFANIMCTVGGTMGFCVTATECSNFGGSRIGDCAMGYGTCCYKAIKCGESSSMNVTYIQNADYPSATSSSGSCIHSITRQDNVCKLRLDFVDFELSDPYVGNAGDNDQGMCLNDQMTVAGVASTQFRYLCGKMPPIWHFYLDVRDASNPTTFTFSLSSAVTKDRKWNIKVTQIDCDRKIPQGCGQYFTGTSGDPLYSFNWGNNGMYLFGMNYAICFRQEKEYCTHSFVDQGLSWVVCADSLAFPSSDYSQVTGAQTHTRECNSLGVALAWPSTINTNNYSPTLIYHYTDQVNRVRTTPVDPAASSPGFYFTWTHNKC